jgi:predicted peptidase
MRFSPALLLLCTPGSVLAAEPFQAAKIESAKLPAAANRGYQLLPPVKGAKAGETFPLVVYLHGAGSKGDDNTKPIGEALPKLLAKPELRERFPCFVLVPQCKDGTRADGRPNNWVNWDGQKDNPPAKWEKADADPTDQLRGAMLALDEVLAKHPIDPARVYLTGVSMGGSGSCNWAAREPDRFAAVVAVCCLSEAAKAKELARVPLRLYHGAADEQVPVDRSRKLAEAVKAAGGAVTYTEYPKAGHNIAGTVFAEKDHAALVWLFAQKREGKK